MSTISSAIRHLSGAKFLDDDQRTEVADVFHDTKNAGLLDYVACWYHKAADYMAERPDTESAFVSTNSITQGEQVGVLWPELMQLGVRINFAHRTFQWSSAARGKAAVHCVIVGFALHDVARKTIFEYADIKEEPHAISVNRINSYLVDASDIFLEKRSRPLVQHVFCKSENHLWQRWSHRADFGFSRN